KGKKRNETRISPRGRRGSADYNNVPPAEGGGQASQGQPVRARQGGDARRRPAVRQARPVDPLHRSRTAPVDEVPAASVDERAVVIDGVTPVKMCGELGTSLAEAVRLRARIIVHNNTQYT